MFEPLNLPIAPLSLFKDDNKIFVQCLLRKKKILLTPEEWVRQHIIHFFLSELNYPKGLMNIENAMQINKMSRRADLVIYDHAGQALLLVECKAPHVKITEETFFQMSQYNSQLRSKFILASNGLMHIICEIDAEGKINLKDEWPTWSMLNKKN
jgi:hypothetical protein